MYDLADTRVLGGAIARRYRVTTAQLMRWNNIKSAHKLRIGQRLRIEGR